MGKVKQLLAFKTTDGVFFEDRCEATRHQNNINRRIAIDEWVEANCWTSMDKTDIADLIYSGWDNLKHIIDSSNKE